MSRVNCTLIKTGWAYRKWQLEFGSESHILEYTARGWAPERVLLDGLLVATNLVVTGQYPWYDFQIDTHEGHLHVARWPWYTVKRMKLMIDGDVVYAERWTVER